MTLHCAFPQAAIPPPPLQLVEEINHRVVNAYAEAISTLSLAAAGSASRQAREAIAHAAGRLRAHAEAHRALLPPPVGGETNLADYIGQLCASFSNAALADRGAHIALQTEDVWLPAERCWRIGLILAELIRNAARHGLAGGAGAIVVRIAADDARVSCLVGDNGRCPANPALGRGRRLAQSLAADLGGSVEWWFSHDGCVASLDVPLAQD